MQKGFASFWLNPTTVSFSSKRKEKNNMYFFTQILFDNDNNVSGKGTSDYSNADAAEQAFHTAIASAISKPETGKIVAMVFDSEGVIKHRRVWVRS